MTTVKQLIKDIIASYDPTLDLTDSSSLTDLLINPAAAMMEPIIAQITFLLNNLGLTDPANMNTSELEAIGANFLISRIQGSKGSGSVELLYTVPQALTIPLGTTFTSNTGIEFATTQAMYVSADTMAQNAWNYPYYSSGPIPVEATSTGAVTSIGINEISSTSLDPAPARVTNPSAFSGGSDSESNTDYANRILTEVISGALGSALSMRTTLRKSFPTIMDVEARGMQDDEMLRDLVVSGVSLFDSRTIVDFYGKVSGMNELPFPESQAYYGVFYDDPSTSGLQPDLPAIEYFTTEYTTDNYSGIFKLDDALKATIQTLVVLEDDLAGETLNARWVLGDGLNAVDKMLTPNESILATNVTPHLLRLGNKYSGNVELSNMPITVTTTFMYSILNYLARCAQLEATAASWVSKPVTNYDEFVEYLADLAVAKRSLEYSPEFIQMSQQVADAIAPETANNYFPIASCPLAVHAGIVVEGTFETDDDTADGRLSYVTVLRDANSMDPANGYGFAWMKGDGSKYNIYLVDNSALANDLFINKENVVNPQGENAWKAATKKALTINTRYSYKLEIGVDYSMSLKIWATSGSEPLVPTVSCGAPASLPAASGSHFGFGVLGTHNNQWYYGGIKVTTSSGIHTASLFQLKAHAADFPNDSNITIDYYGYGHDGVEASTNWGLSAFIRKKVGGVWTWVEVGTNTASDVTDRVLTKISTSFDVTTDYRDTGECIYVLVTSTYASTEVTEVSTYYISLTNTTQEGIHTGGCADIYINDTSKILLAENTISNISGSIALSAANGFYVPLHSIVQVQTALSGDALAVNSDWVLESTAGLAYAYSTLENPQLVFNPTLIDYSIRVLYRHYQSGTAIQALLDSPENRYSGTSNLAKCMPPAIVTINTLDYRGTPSVATMRSKLEDYINGASTTITLDDILNTLYANGASWVDVVNADISVTQYDYRRVVSDPVQLTTSYTLSPSLSRFFADDTSLAALRRL
jgi:hypothetical protein